MSLEKLRQDGWNIDSLKLENLLADDYDENMGPQELKDILLDVCINVCDLFFNVKVKTKI
jgi:hypothetical protein